MTTTALSKRLFILSLFVFVASNASGQLPFSFDRRFISESSYCTSLKEGNPEVEAEISHDLVRFSEEPSQQLGTREIFRIVDHGAPGDIRSIFIRTIERVDSTCVVTVKFVRNARKNQVFVHTKTYDISKWRDFEALAARYFTATSAYDNEKIAYVDDTYQKYELNSSMGYRLLTEKEASPDIMWLRDYLDYLISPIFESKCD